MPINNPPTWSNIIDKPTTVAGLGLSDFNLSAINAQAGVTAGAVGSYAMLYPLTAQTLTAGQTLAGSSLSYGPNSAGSSSPAGTWRLMGNLSSSVGAAVWLRIS